MCLFFIFLILLLLLLLLLFCLFLLFFFFGSPSKNIMSEMAYAPIYYKTLQMFRRPFIPLRSLHKMSFPIQKSESEWRAQLSPAQFAILRGKGTERPGTGEYLHSNETGTYNCAGCDSPLYKSSTKFDSHCGWPSFYEALPGALKYNVDNSHGMERTEMICAQCGGHLGHVFKGEGYDNPTDERHCVNSISLKFAKE